MTERLRIAFQGERGSFTEEAATDRFGEDVEFMGFESLNSVFNAVEVGAADYAVVPAENSLVGTVGETYDMLLVHSLSIVGETILRIEHNLLSVKDASLDDVTTVWSHPQALGQCSRFIEKEGLAVVPKPNTAMAAKELGENPDPTVGVIASRRAAEIYGLDVLISNIEDNPNNYTRFFVLGREIPKPTGKDKTSIIFSTSHEPGSLYRCLEVFASKGINLTKIESRPTKLRPWEYYFYLDFEGHVEDEIPREALRELAGRAIILKVLGSYPRASEPSCSRK